MEVSDLSDKVSSLFEVMVPPLDQPTQTIKFGTLPEISINVVYILLEEYRKQFNWADWSDMSWKKNLKEKRIA